LLFIHTEIRLFLRQKHCCGILMFVGCVTFQLGEGRAGCGHSNLARCGRAFQFCEGCCCSNFVRCIPILRGCVVEAFQYYEGGWFQSLSWGYAAFQSCEGVWHPNLVRSGFQFCKACGIPILWGVCAWIPILWMCVGSNLANVHVFQSREGFQSRVCVWHSNLWVCVDSNLVRVVVFQSCVVSYLYRGVCGIPIRWGVCGCQSCHSSLARMCVIPISWRCVAFQSGRERNQNNTNRRITRLPTHWTDFTVFVSVLQNRQPTWQISHCYVPESEFRPTTISNLTPWLLVS
jgi:hypothetical protein